MSAEVSTIPNPQWNVSSSSSSSSLSASRQLHVSNGRHNLGGGPQAGGLFQFEHTPPKDADYQRLNLNVRAVKDSERRYALDLVRQYDCVREGEVPLFIGMALRTSLSVTKKQKPTRRIYIVGKYRLLAFVRKKLGGHKLARNFHILELVEIYQQEPYRAAFKFVAANDKKQRLAGFALHGAAVPEIIYCLRLAYLRITCGYPPEYGFTLRAPSSMLLPLDWDKYQRMDPEVVGPANGFIETYLAQCNYFGMQPNNQLVQFICDLWAKNITDLNLTLCPGFEPKSAVSFQLEPIIGALNHNTYFKSVTIEDVARKEALSAVIMALRFNQTLTKITLAYLPDLSAENCMDLRNAVINNPDIKLQILDLHGTSISTKGAAHLATALEVLPHSLHTLIISESNIGTKGMQEVIMALCKNFGMSLGMQVLDLSQNKLDEGCSKWLETWLEKTGNHSHLRKLHMSRCGMMDLTFIAKPLRQLIHLVELDISYNKVDDGITQLIRVALEDTSTLGTLNLEHCGLSGYNAAAILTALVTNKKLQETKLNIADNELPDTDADMLATAVKKGLNLHTLNIARNKLKHSGLIQMVEALQAAVTPKIHTLIFDNCAEISKPNQGTAVAEALIALINPQSSPLRILSIAGGFTKVVVPLLDRLHSNCPLEEFDISNNKIGDAGAVALSEMLRDNITLKVLKCDNNAITLTGWLSFLSLFMYNHTLQWMDHPWQDYARIYSSYPNTPQGERKRQRLREVLLSIQRAIESNNVNFRGWFPVEEAMDPPAYRRTDPAPTDVTPKCTAPPELEEFATSLKAQEADARKRRARGSMIIATKEKESWEVAPPPPEPTKDAIIEGPLTLLSNVVKSWKTRYFVLKNDNVLYYWKTAQQVSKKPAGRISLSGTKVMPLAQEGITKAYCMEVHTEARTYYVCAPDKESMDRWLFALKKAARVDDDGGPERHPTTVSAKQITDDVSPPPARVATPSSSEAPVPSPPAPSTPVTAKAAKLDDYTAPPALPSRDGDDDDDDLGKGKGKEVQRQLPPPPVQAGPALAPQRQFVAATPTRTVIPVLPPEPYPAVQFPAPSAAPQPAPAQLLPPAAPLYPPVAPPAAAPPPPAPPAAPPPPPVNVAKAYIPRMLSRPKEEQKVQEESQLGGSSVQDILASRVALAMSQRRSSIAMDEYASDEVSDWDSDGGD